MALSRRRRGGGNGLDAWPGYVDALSTLLMVIIFVLLVFVLAQAFLSVALSGRDRALDRLNRQMAEMSDMLSLERGKSNELRLSITQLNRDVTAANAARSDLAGQLDALRATAGRTALERDAIRAERDRLANQLADAQLQLEAATARVGQAQSQLADATTRGNAAAQDLEDLKRQMSETVKADRATIDARLADVARLEQQVEALTALRDELTKQVQTAASATVTEQQKNAALVAQLADADKLGDSARAQIALLNEQLAALRAQMAQVSGALDLAQSQGRDKDAQIANLGSRLNAALAAKVEELQGYRSEFFGKLRAVLANRPGISVVGDRFVFQSEVLFPVGSADLTPDGKDQIDALANTLRQIAGEIPPGVNWLLRVDGHADRQKISGGSFADNWQLSAARAINVVKLLIADGVPADRVAAVAFGDNQPLDAADTPEAYAKNRRIELRLTDR